MDRTPIIPWAGERRKHFCLLQARVPPEEVMQQRIDVRVIPEIPEADYAAFRSMIQLLPPSYDAWRLFHDVELQKRGEGAIVQTVTIEQFRNHLQDRAPGTLGELLRCATRLASREVTRRSTLVASPCQEVPTVAHPRRP
jgi:hypothetical protein